MSTNTPLRRTSRAIKPSLKLKESDFGLQMNFLHPSSSDEDLSDGFNANTDLERPAILHENEVVHGDDIFKFHTRKLKTNLALKVAEACSQKTPFVVRTKTKSRIEKVIEENSGSEYELSSEDNSSSSNEASSSKDEDSDESEFEAEDPKQHKNKQYKESSLQPGNIRSRSKYLINTDDYFENCSSKVKTSNNTLDKLQTPRLPQYELQKLMSEITFSQEHEKCMQKLNRSNESCFKKWLFILNENFNILLYGLGSKRSILKKFQKECLQDVPVVVVNGFFPTLSIKNILDGIITDVLEIQECPANINEASDLIIEEFNNLPEIHLYIIIHNIEGEMLRSNKSQYILAQLAAIRNIHLIASLDHINGPLIWDQKKLSKFNYIWWDVTSYLPYTEETAFERCMMVQQTGTLALSSLRNVFLSLTTNSKSIYMILAKYQLHNGKNQFYQGMSFKDLYMACREAFVVSSDLALRAQLTEFLDHKMIKQKRSTEGTEYINIPLASALLQKFVDENSS